MEWALWILVGLAIFGGASLFNLLHDSRAEVRALRLMLDERSGK